MKLFTIGFTKKTAQLFFEKLIENNVKTVIDVRLNNKSQLAGFTKGNDLRYFLEKIAKINYVHMPIFAPSSDILKKYKKNQIDWATYEKDYIILLESRNIIQKFDPLILDNSCLLCSEATPENCHRRLLAEYLAERIDNIEIIHI